jgi:hypothetical protein
LLVHRRFLLRVTAVRDATGNTISESVLSLDPQDSSASDLDLN